MPKYCKKKEKARESKKKRRKSKKKQEKIKKNIQNFSKNKKKWLKVVGSGQKMCYNYIVKEKV